MASDRLTPHLWPEEYAVVDVSDLVARAVCAKAMPGNGAPAAMLRHGDTITLIAPRSEVPDGATPVAPVEHWRALTLEGASFPAASRILGEATSVLGEVGIPVLAFINGHELLLLLPDDLLGRALAALNQAKLDRLL
jgi:hypothetical protein